MSALRALAAGLLLLSLVGCGSKLTPEQASRVLQQVQQSRRTLSLQGKLTTSINTPDQHLRADAEMQRGPGVIHLKYLSGRFAGWQIIEQDGLVWRVSPAGQPSASPVSPDPGLRLRAEASLQVSSAGPARVAGRWARRYVIVPPGKNVGRLVVAVDAKTQYPLRMQRYAPGGKLISETVYREIRYGVPPPAKVAPPAVAQQRGHEGTTAKGAKTTEKQLEQALGGPLLKPTYLPQGLQLRGYYSRQTRRGVLAEMRYSDGLRTLVVAQLKVPARPPGPQPGAPPNAPGTPGGQARERWPEWRGAGQPRPGAAPRRGMGPQPPGAAQAEKRGWWQRLSRGRDGADDQGRNGPAAGRAGRSLLRERRGDRIVVVGGDLAPEELRKVLASIPHPPGQKPGTKF